MASQNIEPPQEDEVAQISENISNNTEGIPVTDLPWEARLETADQLLAV